MERLSPPAASLQKMQKENGGEMKYCFKCGNFKPDKQFYKQPNHPDGLAYDCIDCRAAYSRKYYRDNRDYINERSKIYYQRRKEKNIDLNMSV